MENQIKLLNENDKRGLSDLELVNELYLFLQGNCPEGMIIGRNHPPKLSEKKAFTIIWYLQEHFALLPDHIERCSSCGDLFDSWNSGIYWESRRKHFCNGCEYKVPENYDRGRK